MDEQSCLMRWSIKPCSQKFEQKKLTTTVLP